MKQFEKRSIPTEKVEYSVEFPKEEQYILKRGKLYNFVCFTKKDLDETEGKQ